MLDETTPDKRLDYDKTNSNRYGCVIFVIEYRDVEQTQTNFRA